MCGEKDNSRGGTSLSPLFAVWLWNYQNVYLPEATCRPIPGIYVNKKLKFSSTYKAILGILPRISQLSVTVEYRHKLNLPLLVSHMQLVINSLVANMKYTSFSLPVHHTYTY